jgi:sensor histidine kinase YesM
MRLLGMVLFSEISIAAFAFLFRMSVDSEANKRRIGEIERLQLQTELKFLKSQMNPHFLFNTINNVYALALSRSDKTPAALLKLSGLLRYLLYECNQPTPYHKEIGALESYVALFQLRYEETLNISLHSEVQSMDMLVEPMLLISLLENAIKHSSIGVAPGAFIEIRLREEEGKLAASIKNSRSELNHTIREAGDGKDDRGRDIAGGITDDPAGAAAGGIGLQNIYKRLEMLAPGLSSRNLQIKETPGIFEVFIKIPGI